jgi:hypothetical protein
VRGEDLREALVDLRRLVGTAADEHDALLAQALLHGGPVDETGLMQDLTPTSASPSPSPLLRASGGAPGGPQQLLTQRRRHFAPAASPTRDGYRAQIAETTTFHWLSVGVSS